MHQKQSVLDVGTPGVSFLGFYGVISMEGCEVVTSKTSF
jgi:hypothetical protein